MSNWEKLATDPAFKAMFEEGRLAEMMKRIEKELVIKKDLSNRDRLYNQGFLAGLNHAKQFPMIELDLERERKFKAIEAQEAIRKRPFKALRFAG